MRLGVCDLNVIDVLPVPQRLEDAVGKTKDQQVLHRLFAEIMIDAINLLSSKTDASVLLSARALSRSWPNGFSTMMRVQDFFAGRFRVLCRL